MRDLTIKLNRGITLVEILLVLGLLAVIASVAVPSVGTATTRAELRSATENLQYSIRIARNTARMSESKVTMNIIENENSESVQRITFSLSKTASKSLSQPEIQEDRLPEGIKLVSTHPSFVFDGRGIVQNPGEIMLVSRTDDSFNTRTLIE